MRQYIEAPGIFRISPGRERAGMCLALCAIVALAYATWSVTSIQLSVLAIVPLAFFAWFNRSGSAYLLAVTQAVAFTYFDYDGAQAALVNVPVDALLTVVSYVAVVACVHAARRSLSDTLSLREQLAETSENAAIQGWLADHDALTSVANRRTFKRAVMHATASAGLTGRPIGLIVGDIDNFKAVNTLHGYASGDRLLCTFFNRAQTLGPAALVGRLDGDQVGMLFSEISSDFELFAVAQKIARELSEPYAFEGQSIRITVTLATAMFPADAGDADSLLELLEQRLYAAKRR